MSFIVFKYVSFQNRQTNKLPREAIVIRIVIRVIPKIQRIGPKHTSGKSLMQIRAIPPQNLHVVDCNLARDTSLVKVSCKSVNYFSGDPRNGQTDKQTNQHDQKHTFLAEVLDEWMNLAFCDFRAYAGKTGPDEPVTMLRLVRWIRWHCLSDNPEIEVEHATTRSRRLPTTIQNPYTWAMKKYIVSVKLE